MRIALFTDTYPPQVNGVARTLARLARALEERGHVARVFTTTDPDANGSETEHRYESRAFWAYPQLRASFPRMAAVRRDVDAFKPTLAHVATPFGIGVAGRAAARRLGVPVVSSYHTSLADYARFYRMGMLSGIGWHYLRWFHNGTRRTYAPTTTVTDQLAQRGFRGLTLWPRGVDLRQFSADFRSEALRRHWGAGPGTTVVTYIGRLAPEKGIETALEAMRTASAALTDVVCVVVGSGPFEIQARRLAPPGTIFTGQLSGAPLGEAYASADILLFPSTTDTFGNVMLEGMASGLAVIAADTPQSREVVTNRHGVFVPPAKAAAFAEAIITLARQPEQLCRARQAAFAEATAKAWDPVFDALIDDYLAVIDEARALVAI